MNLERSTIHVSFNDHRSRCSHVLVFEPRMSIITTTRKVSMDIIVGVDPGLKGAIVKLDVVAHTLQLFEMPIHTIERTKVKRYVDQVKLGSILCDDRILGCFIEEVNARPEEGVVSSFTFGQAYGTVIGSLGALAIPTTFIRPAIWKKVLKVPAEKDAARFRASQIFPQCAKAWEKSHQDGLAEAALIAFYGASDMHFHPTQRFTLIE